MEKDIFCKIIDKELPADILFEDEDIIVINDINPQAPVHMLVIPKKHVELVVEGSHEDVDLLGNMLFVAGKMAVKQNIDKSGYRLIINQGSDGGQLIPHLHIHVLGGKHLGAKLVK